MNVVAGATIAFAIAIIYPQLQLSKQVNSGAVVVFFFIGSVNAMILIKRKTTIKPQIFVLAFGMLMILGGYVVNSGII